MFTPGEIKRIEFSKAMNGYKKQEVEEFLYDISKDYEKLLAKLDKYYDRIEELEEQIKEYEEQKKTINDAILAAQKMSNDTIEEVKKKTVSIKTDAEGKAKDIIDSARAKADEMISLAETQAKQTVDDANKKADDMLYATRMKLQSEEKKLTVMKHLVTDFKDEILAKYKEHIQMFLDTYKSAKTMFDQPDFPKEAESEKTESEEKVAETAEKPTEEQSVDDASAENVEENPAEKEAAEKIKESVENEDEKEEKNSGKGFSIDVSALDDEKSEDDWSEKNADDNDGYDDGMSNKEPPLSFFPGVKTSDKDEADEPGDKEDFRILWDEEDDDE